MLLASVLALVALAVVVATIHFEQRHRARGVPESSLAVPDLRDVERPDQLAAAPLPRALMGYHPVAVRGALGELGAAYAELAALSDAHTVEVALARARGLAAMSAQGTEAAGDELDPGSPGHLNHGDRVDHVEHGDRVEHVDRVDHVDRRDRDGPVPDAGGPEGTRPAATGVTIGVHDIDERGKPHHGE